MNNRSKAGDRRDHECMFRMHRPGIAPTQSARIVLPFLGDEYLFDGMEDFAMSQTKEASKRKRLKKAVPVLGLAGMSLSLAGGASAATTGPATDTPLKDTTRHHEVFLGEEEMADVSLATFYVFDKENAGKPQLGQQLAWHGCGGCKGCGGCRGCRGCARGCGCRGCGCGGCGGCSCVCTPVTPWFCY
jgi:hypothetical protein